MKYTQEDFLAQAFAAHGNRYDYSRTVYKTNRAHVSITCLIHGEFKQIPYSHVSQKMGCRKCASAKQSQSRTYTTEQFIAAAKVIHGTKYDYSLASYSGGKSKVLITCQKHGNFSQVAHTHLNASGCPQCGELSKWEKVRSPTWVERTNGRAGILYFLRIFKADEEFFKIGVTVQEVKRRYRSKKYNLNGYQYELLAQHTSADVVRIWGWEQSILETFAHLRYKPKTDFQGASECFSGCSEILNIFPL